MRRSKFKEVVGVSFALLFVLTIVVGWVFFWVSSMDDCTSRHSVGWCMNAESVDFGD